MARAVDSIKTLLIITTCYDEPRRTMGSVPKLARQLSKHCRVVVFSGGSRTRVENRSKNLRVYFYKELLIPDPVNNGFIPGMFTHVGEVLRKEKPDAVLNMKHMFYANLLGPYLKRRGYCVVTATDTLPGYVWWTASPIANAALWLGARTLGNYVLRGSDKVVLFHEGLVSTAKQLQLPYAVVHNGVELDTVKAAKPRKLAGKINVLYVGRLESVKGYKTIFEAMRVVINKHPEVHFYHLGDNSGKENFLLNHRSEQFHIEGRKSIEEVYSYMKAADIILLASRSEGLPNVLMEGMTCGCVPVSTPVGAVPSLLEHGKLGRMFEYGNHEALAREVNWLIAHPASRKRMAVSGAAKIAREYDYKRISAQYMGLLNDCALRKV